MINDMLELLTFIGGIVLLVALVTFVPIGGLAYYSSCRSADIYNAQHHTTYTCGDFFWAGDQINAGTSTINLRQPKE